MAAKKKATKRAPRSAWIAWVGCKGAAFTTKAVAARFPGEVLGPYVLAERVRNR